MKRLFISDCEGPISKNDNAFELAEHFIPSGDRLFANISKYDDVLADIVQKPGYTAGTTLKLILPFFKAYGVTDRQMEEFSQQNIVLIKDTKTTLAHVQRLADSYIVSTSYEHYIRSLCKATDFPFQNTYCTRLSLDQAPITVDEKETLREMAQEIAHMRTIDISGINSIENFCDCDQTLLQRLDEIFWSEIPKMTVGKLLTDVVTVGGEQKAESIRDAAKKLGAKFENAMYVGDSITDVEAFQLVRNKGGLSVSFNGNSYAIKAAEVAVQSESNLITATLADIFCKHGKQAAIKAIENWSIEALKKADVDPAILAELTTLYPDCLPKVQIVTSKNMGSLIKESSEFRKKVRGINIGRLG
ncbi:HAD hydrolase family protein [Candidatus Bathyarchaeota archaeon]|nr:HAD hydrolase family protein [Candidatus Bathyarchaeota archaeon]